MPYTIQQAKKLAKGIVKVQISKQLADDGTRQVLIYNQGFKDSGCGIAPLHLNMRLTPGIEEAMGLHMKLYFYYRIKKKGFMRKTKAVELLHEAPTQSW